MLELKDRATLNAVGQLYEETLAKLTPLGYTDSKSINLDEVEDLPEDNVEEAEEILRDAISKALKIIG
jgi:hypothetical protein